MFSCFCGRSNIFVTIEYNATIFALNIPYIFVSNNAVILPRHFLSKKLPSITVAALSLGTNEVFSGKKMV